MPNIYEVVLNEEEMKSLQEFKQFDHETPSSSVGFKPLRINHPFVRVTGDFAISSFNSLSQTHVKKNEPNNLHDYVFRSCKYRKWKSDEYCFFITVEAVEEGILGVYESQVICSDCEFRVTLTLSKFVCTDQTPKGKIAMDISQLSRLRSICKSVKGLKKDIDIYLKRSTGGKKKFKMEVVYPLNKWGRMTRAAGKKKCKPAAKVIGFNRTISDEKKVKVATELMCLKEHYNKVLKGLSEVFYKDTQRLFSPDCCRTTNQDEWSMDADIDFNSGLVRRVEGTPGYDYYYPSQGFGLGSP